MLQSQSQLTLRTLLKVCTSSPSVQKPSPQQKQNYACSSDPQRHVKLKPRTSGRKSLLLGSYFQSATASHAFPRSQYHVWFGERKKQCHCCAAAGSSTLQSMRSLLVGCVLRLTKTHASATASLLLPTCSLRSPMQCLGQGRLLVRHKSGLMASAQQRRGAQCANGSQCHDHNAPLATKKTLASEAACGLRLFAVTLLRFDI